MSREFQKLNEKSDKIPISLDNMFNRKETAKFCMAKEEDGFDDEAFQSPTFSKKDPKTP